MKKIFSMFALIAAVFASGQNLKNSRGPVNPEVGPPVLNTDEYLNNISTKAVRDLEKKFTTDGNEKWYQMSYGFRATFRLGDIGYRVDYDKKGNRLDLLLTYDEKKLSSAIRSIVKTVYYDYSITLVEEIAKPHNDAIYVIHLENETEWINLRVQNREMQEWQRYCKPKESSTINK